MTKLLRVLQVFAAGWLAGWQAVFGGTYGWQSHNWFGLFDPRMDVYWNKYIEDKTYHNLKDVGAEYVSTGDVRPSRRPYIALCFIGGNLALLAFVAGVGAAWLTRLC